MGQEDQSRFLSAGTRQQQLDRTVVQLARRFLLEVDQRVTEELIRKYVLFSDSAELAKELTGIYRQLIQSLQNANMKASVIGGSIGGIEKLGCVLFDFSPQDVLEQYGPNSDLLLERIVSDVKPTGQIRRTGRSIWPQFCRSVLSGASFLSRFDSAADFAEWVSFFDRDDRARPSLPMLLNKEIHGLGFALACDFLKELGYQDFCKPDVHLKRILVALKLADSSDDYEVFKSIVRIARNNGKKPYEVDKLFWLIGSGRFYDDGLSIGRHADDFIAYTHDHLAV